MCHLWDRYRLVWKIKIGILTFWVYGVYLYGVAWLLFKLLQAGLIRNEAKFTTHEPEEKLDPIGMEHLYFRKQKIGYLMSRSITKFGNNFHDSLCYLIVLVDWFNSFSLTILLIALMSNVLFSALLILCVGLCFSSLIFMIEKLTFNCAKIPTQ